MLGVSGGKFSNLRWPACLLGVVKASVLVLIRLCLDVCCDVSLALLRGLLSVESKSRRELCAGSFMGSRPGLWPKHWRCGLLESACVLETLLAGIN